jgi:hypothetical protein
MPLAIRRVNFILSLNLYWVRTGLVIPIRGSGLLEERCWGEVEEEKAGGSGLSVPWIWS